MLAAPGWRGGHRYPKQAVVDPRARPRADGAPEPVAVVGNQNRSAGGVFVTTRPTPAQIEPLSLGSENIGERVEDRLQLRVAIALLLNRFRVEPEGDVVDEH